MKKQRKQLLIMLAALVLLGGGYFGLRYYNQIQTEKELAALDDSIPIMSLNEDDIIKLTHNYNGVTYSYEKKDGTWYYTEDPSLSLNQLRLNTIAERMASMSAEKVIENVTDMSQYGLENPEKFFTFETATESYTFYAGDYNSMSILHYICREGEENTVYIVQPLIATGFNMTVDELIEEEETTETTSEAASSSAS